MVSVPALRAWSDGEALLDLVTNLPTVYPSTVSSANVAAQIVVPRAGWVRKMYARVNVAPGGVQTAIFTLFRNSVITALTATITGTAKEASDLIHQIRVAEGDKLTIIVSLSVLAVSVEASRVEVEFA